MLARHFDLQALGYALVCAVIASVAWFIGLPRWYAWMAAVCAVAGVIVAWVEAHREVE